MSAFELLFNLYHVPLCNFAKVYVKQLVIADEIVQETFIKIWEVRATLDEEKSIKSFLFQCVHNNCLNYIKKAGNNSKSGQEYLNDLQFRAEVLGSAEASVIDTLVADELEFQIEKIIDSLPDQCRQVFIFSRFHDMSYADIAKKLNISLNTVKTQISRALQKLRAGLKEF